MYISISYIYIYIHGNYYDKLIHPWSGPSYRTNKPPNRSRACSLARPSRDQRARPRARARAPNMSSRAPESNDMESSSQDKSCRHLKLLPYHGGSHQTSKLHVDWGLDRIMEEQKGRGARGSWETRKRFSGCLSFLRDYVFWKGLTYSVGL
jgi:hypothetical protein